MSTAGNRPLAQAPRLASAVNRVAERADGLLTQAASRLERHLMQATTGVAARAAGVIPLFSRSASHAVYRFGKQSEPMAETSSSLVMSCVPAAAYRTAAIVDHMGERAHDIVLHTVENVLGAPAPHEDETDESLRQIGRDLAFYVDQGLDAFCFGLSVKARTDEIRRLRQERRHQRAEKKR